MVVEAEADEAEEEEAEEKAEEKAEEEALGSSVLSSSSKVALRVLCPGGGASSSSLCEMSSLNMFWLSLFRREVKDSTLSTALIAEFNRTTMDGLKCDSDRYCSAWPPVPPVPPV